MRYITEDEFYRWLEFMSCEYRNSKVGNTFESLLDSFKNNDAPLDYQIEFRELEEEQAVAYSF